MADHWAQAEEISINLNTLQKSPIASVLLIIFNKLRIVWEFFITQLNFLKAAVFNVALLAIKSKHQLKIIFQQCE